MDEEYIADLHCHPCCFRRGMLDNRPDTVEGLFEAGVKAGVDILAITDFGQQACFSYFVAMRRYLDDSYETGLLTIEGRPIAFKVKKEDDEVLFLRTQEVPTQDGHVLILGGHRSLDDGESAEDTLTKAKYSLGAITGIDHPYIPRTRGGLGEKKLVELMEKGLVDFIEEHNAQIRNPFVFTDPFDLDVANNRARGFCELYGIKGICVSDAHLVQDIGLGSISFEAFDTNDGYTLRGLLKEIITSGEFGKRKNYTRIFNLWKWHLNILLKRGQ